MGRGKRKTQSQASREVRKTISAISPLAALTAQIAKSIVAELGVPLEIAERAVSEPRAGFGDLSVSCQSLGRSLGRDPSELTEELALALSGVDGVASAAATGPFCNLRLDTGTLVERLVEQALSTASQPFGLLRGREGEGQRLVLEFSSPNAARALGFHHLRGTALGAALGRLYEARGYEVKRVNYLGDFGHNIGLLLWKLDQVPDGKAGQISPARLQELYVLANQDEIRDPTGVKTGARLWIDRLLDEDNTALRRWHLIVDASTTSLKQTYARLGIEFDDWRGESNYVDEARVVAKQLLEAGVAAKGEGGSIYVPGQDGSQPIVLLTQSGHTTYESRDIAALRRRYSDYGYDRSLYLTDVGQGGRFEALLAAAAQGLEPEASERAEHLGFGLMRLGGAKAKARQGTTLPLDDVLDEAVKQARSVVEDRCLDERELAQLAEQVGVGAVVFSQLRMRRAADFDFDLSRAVSLQGETAPRVQYTYARTRAILRKSGVEIQEALEHGKSELLGAPEEHAVSIAVARLAESGSRALQADDVSCVAGSLLMLADAWASYQAAGKAERSLRILTPEPELRAARLKLAALVATSIKDGLELLGIAAPERM